jgi:hypothetical protein
VAAFDYGSDVVERFLLLPVEQFFLGFDIAVCGHIAVLFAGQVVQIQAPLCVVRSALRLSCAKVVPNLRHQTLFNFFHSFIPFIFVFCFVLFFYFLKIPRSLAKNFQPKSGLASAPSALLGRATSSRCIAGRVTRHAVFHGFTTALFLRGLSPADECAS